MPRTGDYSLGKIYKLVSNETDDIYIGSTSQRLLSKRFESHKKDYKCWLNGYKHYVSSFEIFKYDDCQIILIENFPCSDKHELLARERYWIENTQCVNKCLPQRSKQEYRTDNHDKILESKKEFYYNNREKILEKQKEYRDLNKDKIEERSKSYRELHREDKREYDKERRERLHDEIREKKIEYYEATREKRTELIICPICNSTIQKVYLNLHQKTLKCQSHINKDIENNSD